MESFNYNSEYLKKHFADVYREVFSVSSQVVSAPGAVLWAGNYAVMAGDIAIVQNIPLRVYVGIEETSDKDITIGNCLVFDRNTKQFVAYHMHEAIEKELLHYVSSEINKNIIAENRLKGFKFNILSEMPIGYGANASGALATALVTALFLYFGKADIKTILAWQGMPLSKLRHNNLFDDIFRYSWKLEMIFHGGLTSGTGALAPLIPGNSPIVYFIKTENTEVGGSFGHGCDAGKQAKKDYNFIDNLDYQAFRVSELNGDNEDYFCPFDFGLIGTGEATTNIIANRALEIFEQNTLQTKDFANKISNHIKEKHGVDFEFFSPILKNNNQDSVLKDFYSLVSVWSANILQALFELNQKCLSVESFKKLNRNLKKYNSLFECMEIHHPFSSKVYDLIEQRCGKTEDDYGVGLKFLNVSHGGYLLFVAGSDRARQRLAKIVEDLKTELEEEISIDWLFSRDGVDDHGVVVEQDIKNELYSDFISHGSVQVIHLAGKYGVHEDIYTVDDFEKHKPEMDVLLDPQRNEIYIRGEKITSKEIKTATTTIAVLEVILKNFGEILPKSKLPKSNYLNDRNEFQSKIATPLVKVIEKRLKRRIAFNVKGKIIHFYVNFDPKDVEFYYIKKEF